MIRNYFTIAIRYLQKNKLYTIVNVVGLAIGVASCILIALYVSHEMSYDRFHVNADRIARVTWEYSFEGNPNKVALTGTKVGPEFKRKFPEIESYVRTMKYPRVIAYGNKMFDEANFLYADSAFFTVFSFPLISGDRATVLDGPDKLVITKSMATKYFGNTAPVGQTVKVGTKNFLITGVAEDGPDNSQLKFDFVASFTSLNASKTEKWNEANYITYFLLGSGKQLNSVQEKINGYSKTDLRKEMGLQGNSYSSFHLEPLTAVHLHSEQDGFEPNGNILYLYVLGAVAVLILLIACVNYTNLSIAQSAGRSAEVGMRKVLGAANKQVFYQFITESLLLVLISVLVGLGIASLLLPYFNQLAGKQFTGSVLLRPEVIISLFILAFLVTLAAGAYPSMILSAGRITNILKSGFRFTGSNALRRSLIVFQFVTSFFLMVCTIIILQQLSYIQNKDLGYDKEQVVILPIDNTILLMYDDIKKAFTANSHIASVTGAYEAPTHIGWSDGLSKESGSNNSSSISINALPVDEDFVKTMNLKIIAGNDFNQTDVQQFDTSNGGKNLHYSYMLNESAAKALGWTPQEAIGKIVNKGTSGTIKAVVKDFHFRSFHEAVGPLVIFLDKTMVREMFVKVKGNVPAALGFLEKTWKERITGRPFEYHFLDEDFAALYKAEQKTSGVFTAFAAVAILLACLGLFALTTYSVVRRTREIGIRKILGAKPVNILTLISNDFLKLICISFLLATPLVWYVMNKWLGNFVYRISIHWEVFVLAAMATLVIALATISIRAMQTAFSNPVKNMRIE
ncbi:MAG TPA: ABC transporter permease [Flavitalea sp.]|nr:ABC transporter permease [Flavitalea sp.]